MSEQVREVQVKLGSERAKEVMEEPVEIKEEPIKVRIKIDESAGNREQRSFLRSHLSKHTRRETPVYLLRKIKRDGIRRRKTTTRNS